MLLTAVPVGFFAGLFGIGGGLITVPFLFFIFETLGIEKQYLMHLAVGTSFAIIIPPLITVGSNPAPSSSDAINDVVVVLPCVPPTAIDHLSRINSPSISARRTTGINRSLAANTSGLSALTAEETTTTWTSLKFAAFSNSKLSHSIFENSKLFGSDFSYTDLQYSNFESANLSGANLQDANLQNSNFKNANLQFVNFKNPFKAMTSEFDYFSNVNFEGANFYGAYLNKSDLSDTNLKNSNFEGTDLRHANLSGSDLSTSLGFPVDTLQKAQPLVQIFPRIITVECFLDQLSPLLGLISSHRIVQY